LARLYPLDGPPQTITPVGVQFTREELERFLGGPIYFSRRTREIDSYLWEPYGVIFVKQDALIFQLPHNEEAERIYHELIYGRMIAADLEEIQEQLPAHLRERQCNSPYQVD
jgi:hypothetical protein